MLQYINQAISCWKITNSHVGEFSICILQGTGNWYRRKLCRCSCLGILQQCQIYVQFSINNKSIHLIYFNFHIFKLLHLAKCILVYYVKTLRFIHYVYLYIILTRAFATLSITILAAVRAFAISAQTVSNAQAVTS